MNSTSNWIPVANSLATGIQFDVLFDWQNRARPLFESRYGSAGQWAVDTVAEMKRELNDREQWDCNSAEEVWRKSLAIWEIVWEKFCLRIRNECPENQRWLTRVNSFV